jgi:hydrogenase-4 component B
MLVVGVVSGVMGVLYALAQHDLKRLLAYHTVENIGIIVLGIAVGMLGQSAHQPAIAVLGYAGALLHVTNHALFKGLLFLSAGAVLHGTGTAEIERLGGLARRTPVNALMFLVGAAAICGLPPLNGFLSEWVVYGALFSGSIRGVGPSGPLSAVGLVSLALMGGLALACFAKVFGIVFLGEARDAGIRPHGTPGAMKVAMTALALLCILIGVFPGFWVPLTQLPAGQLARLPSAEVYPQMQGLLSPVATLSKLAAALGIATLGLVSLRRWAMARAGRRDTAVAGAATTWGCGYAAPTPRMQYTASSFASALIASFRAFLWPERHVVAPAGPFPARGRVETHTPDVAEQDVFAPLFRAMARLFAMFRTVSWTGEAELRGPAPREPLKRLGPLRTLLGAIVAGLRRGSIQVFLSFIVLTLVTLFFMEAIAAPSAGHLPAKERVRSATTAGVDR